MADKTFPPARADNFKLLDPEAPRTRRIIDAALTVNVPWHPEHEVVFERVAMVDLAERMEHRAHQGGTVRLSPETAIKVAAALRREAEGHPGLHLTHPHHVEDLTREPREILAYCTSATLAIGAWEHYAPQNPGRHLIATWGSWRARDNKRNSA